MVEKKTVNRILLALKILSSTGEIKRDSFIEKAGISGRTFSRSIKDLNF